MPEIISVNPFRCRMWEWHTRLEEHINEETCRAEIDSFRRHGQQLPVLGRPLRGDMTHDFELVYGARRLFVARYLNVQLSLEVRSISDREALIALDIENHQRQELSPYERGRSYDMWLRDGLFSSQDELARTLNISASQVSRLIRMAQLPEVIVDAFSCPHEICETWGRNLMDLLDDPQNERALTSAARSIAKESKQLPPASVFRRLMSAPAQVRESGSEKSEGRDEVVKDEDGRPLFRVRQHRNDTALLLPTNSLSPDVIEEIKRRVAEILQRASTQALDFVGGCTTKTLTDRAISVARRTQTGLALQT